MRRLLLLATALLLVPAASAHPSANRPVAIVAAETANEVLAVSLGEVATTIVRLDTSNLRRPHVAGRLHPRFPGHGIGFAPDGRAVWVSSARAPYVTVYSARTGKVLRVLPAARAPQEVAFSGARAL